MSSTPPPLPREDKGDFGLGRDLSNTRGQRLLNADGTFNVRREGLSWTQGGSLCHDALTVTWGRFLGWTALAYVGINLLFAAVYLLLGNDGLSGASVDRSGGLFWRAFFFSVQTFATIGYGTIVANGIAGNLVVTVEALVGLMAQALITGLLFARFARPTMALQFSTVSVIAPFNGGTALMFRIANRRRNELIELEAQVTVTMRDTDIGGGGRRYYPLPLDRRAVSFLPTTWTLVHPIIADSPLWGMTARDLEAREAEILVLMHGTDETFATRVSSRRSYRSDEVVWGARFRNILNTTRAGGGVSVDLTQIDLYDAVDLPLPAAPHERP
ncbi:ion channel [Gemmatimonas sp.]|uniref:ion channel n=1 Tax=Gemmatimonas sp. TaxID=1962908 RepID=UPI00286E861A|nr:ion channel [Gemmatimonas sp.]